MGIGESPPISESNTKKRRGKKSGFGFLGVEDDGDHLKERRKFRGDEGIAKSFEIFRMREGR